MAKQMECVRNKEYRTRSELLREAWRQYFEGRYGTYTPTKSELAAIRKGRAARTGRPGSKGSVPGDRCRWPAIC